MSLLFIIIYYLFELNHEHHSLTHDYIIKDMPQHSNFNRQWNSLKSEMKLEDRPLRRQLEHFIDRKHDLFVLVQYVKSLAALDLSLDFHRRFHKRSRDVAASIHYWTILCVTGIHMRMDRLHNLPACTKTFRFKLLPKIDLLRSCCIAYLTDQREKIWKPDSRISRFIRCKWNAPDLEASCLDRICNKADAGRYANILVVILSEILHTLGELQNTLDLGTALLEFSRDAEKP